MLKIERKTLLYKTGVEYGDYTINHVLWCSHGCMYPCYAFLMNKRFGKVKDYKDWITPKIVSNAVDLLEKEIPKLRYKIKHVNMCFSTDPFMYRQKEVSKLSLQIIDILNSNGIPVEVLTKGVYPVELLGTSKNDDNYFGISLVSYSEKFRERFEPGAAPVEERLKSLEFLHRQGFKTWVSIEPYPTPNIIQQDIRKLLSKISFVEKIVFGRWNYNSFVNLNFDSKEYYRRIANEVMNFGERKNIEVIIKKEVLT
ncbi:Radical SAM domain protein [Caldicellulosiruptor saccharolyticus DSM 8903]|uniref:Radical SAM domain protein n=1 Tax=Caldicellulosiruptor saccharolyticus (strain ATCC 43494 / DSM 8903 / Tp8T 6331) TaxID=351627 RepID=A4XMP9_CALS8|nr:radical SAM protein [Caldicellulosiruptor saccharolyticus]ABP68184.1 Radical SAM domain protein [Caldicellulosiruptor saccharolyticus DSM 8903]